MTRPLIDCRAHIYAHDMPLSPTAWYRPTAEVPLSNYLAGLEAHGVEKAVLGRVGYDDALANLCDFIPDLRIRRTVGYQTADAFYLG